jgi:cytochrome c-type biogenesis protein CcmH
MEDNPRAGSHPPDPSQARPPARRRGIRTVVLSAVALVGLAALAVGVLWNSLGTPEGTASGGGSATQSARTGSGLSPSAAEGPAIAGTISVAPERRGRVSDSDTLFIIARKGAGGIGPPFAMKRITGPHFPLEYRLGPGDVMMAGTAFEGDVHLSVRLSKSGAAGPGEPGDLEGEYPGQVPVGARGVSIVIARVR